MIETAELQEAMNQCYGTEVYYRHPLFPQYNYTEGVQTFCEKAEAYWFLTDVFIKITQSYKDCSFLSIHLRVELGEADIEFCDGDDKVLEAVHYTYTDCPDGDWHFFFIDGVLLWHMEY